MASIMLIEEVAPLPQAWLITRFFCNCARSRFAMLRSCSAPKPVFTP